MKIELLEIFRACDNSIRFSSIGKLVKIFPKQWFSLFTFFCCCSRQFSDTYKFEMPRPDPWFVVECTKPSKSGLFPIRPDPNALLWWVFVQFRDASSVLNSSTASLQIHCTFRFSCYDQSEYETTGHTHTHSHANKIE